MTKLGYYYITVFCIILIYILYSTLLTALDVPVVQMSTSTNKCVKILDKGKTYKCVDLTNKTKYTVQWVK